jgi:hypothetical protein
MEWFDVCRDRSPRRDRLRLGRVRGVRECGNLVDADNDHHNDADEDRRTQQRGRLPEVRGVHEEAGRERGDLRSESGRWLGRSTDRDTSERCDGPER